MIGFELYLIEQGYSVYHIKYKNGKWNRIDGYEQISTMVNLDNRYEKNGISFTIGLDEKDKPITIIEPRKFMLNDETNRFIKEHTNEEIETFFIN